MKVTVILIIVGDLNLFGIETGKLDNRGGIQITWTR